MRSCSRSLGRPPEPVKRRRKRRRHSPLCFDCSLLYAETAEDVGEVVFWPGCDEDVSHYVQVICAEHPPPKIGLMNGVTRDLPDGFGVRDCGEDDMFEMPRVVKDGRRVVCTVVNFKALFGGYIDCPLSQMLADTGCYAEFG
ncbi:hypothetical protein PI125_g7965 [Phytophthora idaei]|nr:hypothetical protein PI125_g7965 [Phytophthora idaei]